MIEVEAKVAVGDPYLIRKRAGTVARYVTREKKIDDYYTLESLEHYPKKSLRIRKVNGFYKVNFKQSMGYKRGVHAKKEIEFKISDINDFLKLIADFGFRKWLRKEKESEVYKIRKNFHIELNNVKGLGWFVEVEYLAGPNEVEKARKEVAKFMRMLGFSEKECIKSGYTKSLWDKMRAK